MNIHQATWILWTRHSSLDEWSPELFIDSEALDERLHQAIYGEWVLTLVLHPFSAITGTA